MDRARIELDAVRSEVGHQRGRAETLEAERERWEARRTKERERWDARMDALQIERDKLLMEVATLRVQMVVGGGMDEMRWLQSDLVEVRERARFYRGRYHVAVPIDQIEHYRRLTVTSTAGTRTEVGGSDWSVGGSQWIGHT